VSTYRKVRDRASFAFALVSVGAALEMDGDRVSDLRIAWGGVAHRPWRARTAERILLENVLTPDAVREAVDAELAVATSGEDSAYKLPMLRNTTELVLSRLAEAGGTR
jgi:xanthine dehydrogenase YagS FAD-binding subunit